MRLSRKNISHLPDSEAAAPKNGPDSFWARLSIALLMALVLVVAGILSAMTAMRFVIRGQEVEVPELAGMAEEDAADILREHGLVLELDSSRFNSTVPEGLILDQNPRAGTRVKRDRSVRVLLSLGNRQFAVPDLGGSSLRSAQIVLDQRGLSVGNTLYSHTEEGDPSTVVFQAPEAGDVGDDDPAVSVLVSLGSIEQYYVMPDVTGQPAEEVTSRLRSEGFRLAEVTYVPQSDVGQGRIVHQQPAAGYKVSKNDIIFLEVSP